MVGTVADIRGELSKDVDSLAKAITNLYDKYNDLRQGWLKARKEQRDFVFATDTRQTAVGLLPWKNSTTIPKLCQIRDNLHANYMTALYPNDKFLDWEAGDNDSVEKEKATAIVTYMSNKLRQQNYRDTLSKLVYDYIDYGNVFARTEYMSKMMEDENGEQFATYIGPKIVRISPEDIVFNPLAPSFAESPKMTRELVTLGELLSRVEEEPENSGWMREAIDKVKNRRTYLSSCRSQDVNKASGYSIQGFGNYHEYIGSGYVEVINFEGTIYDHDNDRLYKNYVITVIDRSFIVRKIANPSWIGESSIKHTGWRQRPDNLYAMGPLDNIVGMQYRIDHLENVKADFFDLTAHPPIKVKGLVESFDWAPFEQINCGEGDVELLNVNSSAFSANTDITMLMMLMDEMAGAPKQAVGARTPGEKTMFEVQTLEQNAAKMFTDMVINFEINFEEPLLNQALEVSRRNIDGYDLVSVMDDDLGVKSFLMITKEDIKASGRLRPIAARNFAQRAQIIQNLVGASQLLADQGIRRHWSGKKLAQLLEEGLRLDRFSLYQENAQITEDLEAQALSNAGQQVVQEENATDTNPEIPQ